MVLAVNCAPQAPAEGQAFCSSISRSAIGHRADRMLADRLVDVLNGDRLALEGAGQNRAAIDEDRRHVEPAHRHHHAGLRLVAAGDADQRVIGMAAHRQFDGIGDHLARRQRGLHAGMAHGDAVGHGDGAELARRGADGGDAHLDRLRLPHQRDIARRGLVPAGGDADERLMDLLRGQPHRVIKGAVRRPLRPFGGVAAWQPRFQIGLGVHLTRPGLHRPPRPLVRSKALTGTGASRKCRTVCRHRRLRLSMSKNPMAKKRRLATLQCEISQMFPRCCQVATDFGRRTASR